jgi:hypothetical protein
MPADGNRASVLVGPVKGRSAGRKIRPGAKGLSCAGYHYYPDCIVLIGLLNNTNKLFPHDRGEGIQVVRAVQGYEGKAILNFIECLAEIHGQTLFVCFGFGKNRRIISFTILKPPVQISSSTVSLLLSVSAGAE